MSFERLDSNSKASPSSWAPSPATSFNNRFLEITGLRVRYIGPGTEDKDASSVRADRPVPFGTGLYYFEVEVLNKGRNGFMGVGFQAPNVALHRLPGWEPHSYGYHGDDGHAFHESGKGTVYGPMYGTGDIIGALLNRADRTISFTKNGIDLGVAFSDVGEEVLYPVIGMRTPDEEMTANFGSRPFVADFSKMQASASRLTREKIAQQDVEPWFKAHRKSGVESIVLEYLRHQGYWMSVAAARKDFLSEAQSSSSDEIQDIQLRKQICEAITDLQIDQAIACINNVAPVLLSKQHSLNFKLHCYCFMQLLEAKKVAEALEYGQKTVGPMTFSKEDQELIQDALTLLAHDDIRDSPNYQSLLGKEARSQLAAEVNSAILKHQGRSPCSLLETAVRHAEVLKKEMHTQGIASASLVDFDEYLPTKSKTS